MENDGQLEQIIELLMDLNSHMADLKELIKVSNNQLDIIKSYLDSIDRNSA